MIAITLCAALLGVDHSDLEMSWKGKDRRLNELPEELQSTRAAAAAQFWAEFATEREYSLYLSEGAEVLLLWPADKRSARNQLGLIDKVIKLVDTELPRPEEVVPLEPAPSAEDAARPPGFRPEDLFGDDWRDPDVAEQAGATEAPPAGWGLVEAARGTDTAVLCIARSPADYEAALDTVVTAQEGLRDWLPTAKKAAGALLLRPLLGVVVEGIAENEEWSSDHELVHRCAQLLIARRFGTQPVWVVSGIAWNYEMQLLKSIYCFPYRAGFVWATEHTGWDRGLEHQIEQDGQTLSIATLTTLARDHFDPDSALFAWGFVAYLRQHEPEKIAPFLEAMHKHFDKTGRQATGRHTWKIEAGHEVPAEIQDRVLRMLGTDQVYEWAQEWMVKGKRWKKPRG